MMTIDELAVRLVDLCRRGEFETAQRELYAQDVVCREPRLEPESTYAANSFAALLREHFESETTGLTAVIEKGHRFEAMVAEFHAVEISDAIVADHSFACTMRIDMTMKDGRRIDFRELCVFEVAEGKITTEQFFL